MPQPTNQNPTPQQPNNPQTPKEPEKNAIPTMAIVKGVAKKYNENFLRPGEKLKVDLNKDQVLDVLEKDNAELADKFNLKSDRKKLLSKQSKEVLELLSSYAIKSEEIDTIAEKVAMIVPKVQHAYKKRYNIDARKLSAGRIKSQHLLLAFKMNNEELGIDPLKDTLAMMAKNNPKAIEVLYASLNKKAS